MANREDFLDVKLFDRIDHPRGISWSAGHAGGLRSSLFGFRSLTAASVRNHARRSHQVDDAGHEAEQDKHDEPPGRSRQQVVETPANQRSDNDAGDQLRAKLETARHRRSSGRSVSAFGSGLVSPDFAAVTNF